MMKRATLWQVEFGEVLDEITKKYMESEDKTGYSIQSHLADLLHKIKLSYEEDAKESEYMKLLVEECERLLEKLEDPNLIGNSSNKPRNKSEPTKKKNVPQLCNDINLVYRESESEMITQHDVIGKLKSLKKKKEKTYKDKRIIKEYERIERAWLAIVNAKSKYCDGKEANVSHEDLKLLEIVWKEEIAKYHVGIFPKYKKLVLAIERITSTI